MPSPRRTRAIRHSLREHAMQPVRHTPTNHLYVVSIELASTRTPVELAQEAVDHLYAQDGEQFVYIATDNNVASFALVCAMQPHEAEDWASELATSTGTQLRACDPVNPTHA